MRAQQSEYIKYLGVKGTWKTAVPEGFQMCVLRIRLDLDSGPSKGQKEG